MDTKTVFIVLEWGHHEHGCEDIRVFARLPDAMEHIRNEGGNLLVLAKDVIGQDPEEICKS